MLDPTKFRYRTLLLTENSKRYDITPMITDLTWEELEKQLAARVSFTAKNDKTSKGRLSALAKPGCYIYLYYSYNGGKNKEVFRGRITEWNPSAKASSEQLRIKAYDILYDLQESSDNIYFSSGIYTKSALTQIFSRWKIPIGKYTGANVKHGKIVKKNQKLGSVTLDILAKAKKKGGEESFVRAEKGKVQILACGSNDPVYHLAQTKDLISTTHKISTSGMVTRVKIYGEEKKSGRRPVEATVDGDTKYGIRQKIYIRGEDENMSEAKKEAKSTLKDEGKPEETITLKSPDVPLIRKGDLIHVKAVTVNGYFLVIAASHDAEDMTMELDLKKTKLTETTGESAGGNKNKSDTKQQEEYQVGDIVQFKGGMHYVSSYPDAKGYKVSAGKAKILKKNGSGKAHPWCLQTQNWSQTHVYGWVDDGTFE